MRSKIKKVVGSYQGLLIAILACVVIGIDQNAWARDLNYGGGEQIIYVTPGEPTQVAFPSNVEGGFKAELSNVLLEKQGSYLIVFPKPQLALEGEPIIVHLDDRRSYNLRFSPATEEHPRDDSVNIIDSRSEDMEEEGKPDLEGGTRKFAPTSAVSGLMRNMILVAEFGRQKGIPGYRRSNRYSGETVLKDGALEAKIDEIFMGSNLWGYVLSVENLLDTTQRINPATFRLDGTKAVVADRWELSPRATTAEQSIANQHKAKIYIVTRAKRR